MSQNNGGQAFPVSMGSHNWREGMSLRDYFAGQALSGELAKADGYVTPDKLAEYAYQIADAMILARKTDG